MGIGYIKQINGKHVERRIKHVQIFEEHLQDEEGGGGGEHGTKGSEIMSKAWQTKKQKQPTKGK